MRIPLSKIRKIIREETKRVLKTPPVSLKEPSDVLKVYARALASRGYDVSKAKELGSGYNGVAYGYSDPSRVLKITMNDAEAKTANHLKNKKLARVIPIHDVFKFPGQPSWYGIVEDKATELDQQFKLDFNLYIKIILGNMYSDTFQQIEGSSWSMPWKEIKARVLNNTKPGPEEYSVALEAIQFIEKIELPKLLEELKNNGIEYYDVHADNFMIYKGKLVLVDLGGEDAPGEDPPVLQNT